MKCEDCKFWVPSEGSKTDGECHRFPPTPVPHVDGFVFTSTNVHMWTPDTTYDYWCGEFAPKE